MAYLAPVPSFADLEGVNSTWLDALALTLHEGQDCKPRGKSILEMLQATTATPMDEPVLTIPERKLNYRFAAAEALWMIRGRNQVADLAGVNPHMAQFSDDGETLAGAYGPRIAHQWGYVRSKLTEDTDTRQATMAIWSPNPAPSKDIPCTVSMDFKIRGGRLNMHVGMRSSDLWLGLPYDIFSFSMVGLYMIDCLRPEYPTLMPGIVYITASSSHIYEQHFEVAEEIVEKYHGGLVVPRTRPMHESLYASHPDATQPALFKTLKEVINSGKGSEARWWEI